jgi:hypothetical protein
MNAEEIIARLIDSKAINGEEAICLLQSNEEVVIDAWIARDKNNCVYIHPYKPIKDADEWRNNYSVLNIKEHLFPEIKWEDDKPTKVKLIIKKV